MSIIYSAAYFFSIHLLIIWSFKCKKMGTPRHIQFIIILDKVKQHILWIKSMNQFVWLVNQYIALWINLPNFSFWVVWNNGYLLFSPRYIFFDFSSLMVMTYVRCEHTDVSSNMCTIKRSLQVNLTQMPSCR